MPTGRADVVAHVFARSFRAGALDLHDFVQATLEAEDVERQPRQTGRPP